MCDFPVEILYLIVSFLQFHDLINFQRTCSEANNIGSSLLKSNTTLVSAFWSFCRLLKYQWVDPRCIPELEENDDGKHKLVFFHHSSTSDAFIVRFKKPEMYEFTEFNTSHCQLKFDQTNKKLVLSFKRTSYFHTVELTLDLITKKFKKSSVAYRYTFNNESVFTMQFNCFKPTDHKFYYIENVMCRGDPQYSYFYSIRGFESALKLNSDDAIRISKSVNIDYDRIMIEFSIGKLFSVGVVDFNKRNFSFNSFLIDTPNQNFDFDYLIIQRHIAQFDHFYPLILKPLVIYNFADCFTYSFVDLVESKNTQ